MKRLLLILLFACSAQAQLVLVRTNTIVYPTNITGLTVGGQWITNLAGLGITNIDGSLRVAPNLAEWLSVGTNAFATNLLTRWDDIRIPGMAFNNGVAPPDLGNFLGAGGLQIFMFDGTNDEYGHSAFQMPETWKEGSSIYPHIHWVRTAAPVGVNTNVVWGLEYSIANRDETYPAPTTIYITNGVSGVDWQHQFSEFPEISMSGKTNQAVCVIRLFRDADSASDSYGPDAGFLHFGVRFLKDSAGAVP